MPWKVQRSSRCPASKPWAVVNQTNGNIEGCHPTKERATRQQRALYRNVREGSFTVDARSLTETLQQETGRVEERYLAALISAYERAIRDLAALASRQFALTADASWQPPAEGAALTAAQFTRVAAALNRRLRLTWLQVVVDVGGEPLAGIGIAWDVRHPLVKVQLEKAARRTGDRLGEAVQPVLRKAIAVAYEQGLSVADAAALIRSEIADAAPWQADMLARTDLNSLANGASKSAAKLTGMQFKTWIAVLDEKTRPEHVDAHGQVVPIDGTFDVGGEDADYPGDPNLSDAMAANCRCTLAYGETLAEAEALLADGGSTMSHMTRRQRAKKNRLAAQKRVTEKPNLEQVAEDIAASRSMTLEQAGDVIAGTIEKDIAAGQRVRKATFGAKDALIAATIGAPTQTAWVSDLAFEGMATDDNRYILPNALDWRELPLTLMAMTETGPGGHQGAFVAGQIAKIHRDRKENMAGEPLEEGVTALRGNGFFDMAGENGAEIARLVNDEIMRGISIDMAIHEIAFRDPDSGEVIPKENVEMEDALLGNLQLSIQKGTILAATVCPTPAFADAKIALAASADGTPVIRLWAPFTLEKAITASAAPVKPPREWFLTAEPPGKMPLTVTEDGRVFGHVATWDSCHVGFLPQCVPPPKSDSSYAYFHVCELDTADGTPVTVGKLMFSPNDGGHADRHLSAAKASAYYDRTGMAAAYLRVTDGDHGIWAAGVLNPDLSDEQRQEMRRQLRLNPPSGDWRPINGQYELICALAVAVPGFPTPHATVTIVASGEEIELEDAIIASSGMFAPDPEAVEAMESIGLVDEEMVAERHMAALMSRTNWRDKLAEIVSAE